MHPLVSFSPELLHKPEDVALKAEEVMPLIDDNAWDGCDDIILFGQFLAFPEEIEALLRTWLFQK